MQGHIYIGSKTESHEQGDITFKADAMIVKQVTHRVAELFSCESLSRVKARVVTAWDYCRYNRLLSTIHQSLHDLVKAVKGLVVMSQDLEKMANSLYMNAVPANWASKVRQTRGVRNRRL